MNRKKKAACKHGHVAPLRNKHGALDSIAALGELHKTLKADLARRADAMAPFLKTEIACVECSKPIHAHTAARGCP